MSEKIIRNSLEAALSRVKASFGVRETVPYDVMKQVAPAFLEILASGRSEENPSPEQGYRLTSITSPEQNVVRYELVAPEGTNLPTLEISQAKDLDSISVYMYSGARRQYDFFRRAMEGGRMIDHFTNTAEETAQYLETLTTAFTYLKKYGVKKPVYMLTSGISPRMYPHYPGLQEIIERSEPLEEQNGPEEIIVV